MRIGIGYDIHRLEAGRPLILGGVRIEHEKGLVGHSDADIVCHAITDALLGAAGLGNIGQHFPDTDPAYAGADSTVLLHDAYAKVRASGWRIMNIDCNVIAQKPKLNLHLKAIRARLAEVLDLPVDRVSVKPRTNEQVGAEGREEAMSAQAVVLLEAARS